jgi:hypothetical protein
MAIVQIKGSDQKVRFPNNMIEDQILTALRSQYPRTLNQKIDSALSKPESTISNRDVSLAENTKQKIANFLFDNKIVSDRYGAQRIGDNLSSLLGVLPGIGDAQAGDEFGRAVSEGDGLGIAMGALGAIPLVGDIANKLPMKGKAISSWTDLFEYTPEQLNQQAKFSAPENVIDGIFTVDKGKYKTEYYDDGTSALIEKQNNGIMRSFNQDQTSDNIKRQIIDADSNKPEAIEQATKRKSAIEKQRQADVEKTYKMQHTAPMRGDNPTGDNVSDSFGDDIYTGNALKYFGTGARYDSKAINIIQSMKNKPNADITIYRSVPKTVKEINDGDWVTTTKEYASDHMIGEKNWHVLSKKVKAKDIATDGNSIHEFGYSPEITKVQKKSNQFKK